MTELPSRSPDAYAGEQRRVLVSGAGIDGLATTLALHSVGHDVSLATDVGPFPETSVEGIVVDPEIAWFLDQHGLDASDAITTGAGQYRYVDGDGDVEAAVDVDHHVTASDTLATRLREELPATIVADAHDIDHREFAPHPDRPLGAGPATAATESRQDDPFEFHVAADGWLSETRQRVLPAVTPDYAGYVAWHGTVAESMAPDDLVAQFEDAITASRGRRDLLVGVLLPSPSGETGNVTDRRLSWMWYEPVDPHELGTVLTDRHGTNHDQAVPQGDLQERFTSALHERAGEHAPAFTRLVRATPDPGVEPVVDLAVPRPVVGRTALVGNAAFTARQHTATGTAKAVSDAMALVDALDRYADVDGALADWQHTQAQHGRQLVEQGRQTDLDRLIGEV